MFMIYPFLFVVLTVVACGPGKMADHRTGENPDPECGNYAQAKITCGGQWSAQLKEDIWYYGGSNP